MHLRHHLLHGEQAEHVLEIFLLILAPEKDKDELFSFLADPNIEVHQILQATVATETVSDQVCLAPLILLLLHHLQEVPLLILLLLLLLVDAHELLLLLDVTWCPY
jgi:hypothetical protein